MRFHHVCNVRRKSRLWSTTLWLYPGVYEVAFLCVHILFSFVICTIKIYTHPLIPAPSHLNLSEIFFGVTHYFSLSFIVQENWNTTWIFYFVGEISVCIDSILILPPSSPRFPFHELSYNCWTMFWNHKVINLQIKFIVDGQWKIDPHRESTIRDGIENNILRVDR